MSLSELTADQNQWLDALKVNFPDPERLEPGTYSNREFLEAWGGPLFLQKVVMAMPDPTKASVASVRAILSHQLDSFQSRPEKEQQAERMRAQQNLPNLLAAMSGLPPKIR